MTKTMVDVQQVERYKADHCSRERTGAQTPDVINYLMNGLFQSTVQSNFHKMKRKLSATLQVSVTYGPRLCKVCLRGNEIISTF